MQSSIPSQPSAAPAQGANAPRESLFGFREVIRHSWSFDSARPGAQWKYFLATGIFNSLFAVVLTIGFVTFDSSAKVWATFWQTLLISNCIGFSIHILMELSFGTLLPRLGAKLVRWQQNSLGVVIALIGVFVGYSIAFAILGRNFAMLVAKYPRFAFGMLLIGILGCVVWLLITDSQSRRIRAEAEQARHAEEQERLVAQAKGAELRALQAQIEPHFLFNTLANVLALIDYEPQTAKRMLDSFITHLRHSLDSSRQTHATLGSELELLRTYLQLIEIRMGNRLRFEIECPEELRSTPFAPLLLQPLVENAVKYGLEPKIEGGIVAIRVTRGPDAIRIDVLDDGVGLHAKSTARSGAGMGIKNIRERLNSLYGERAVLEVAARSAPEVGTQSSIILHNSITS